MPTSREEPGTSGSARPSPPPSTAGEPLLPAQLGPYTITGLLGRGGMGIVYSGEDSKLRRSIAIKVLSPRAPLDPDGLARFEREAQLLAALNHPNIATIFSLEEHEGVHLLTMELVPGITLAQRIARGPLRLAEALEIALQIAGALEAAHLAGVIHLDLKPVNIKVTDGARVKLLDFGLARARFLLPSRVGPAGNDSTLEVAFQGTPGYMSPEQIRSERVDHRADIWAFGCVLFELLAGDAAFPGRTAPDRLAAALEYPPAWDRLSPEAPERVRALLAQCLEKEVEDRLDSMSAVRQVLEEETLQPSPPSLILAEMNGPRTPPSNLPLPLTSFIGREDARSEIARLLARERLVTVTGPGGCGKTRLSLEVGHELRPRFPDGVWLVELAPIAEPERVGQAVANALGVREDSRSPLEQTLRRHLRAREVLLVLDNCEHLLEACARWSEVLLQNCPKLRVLATSRERLALAGEVLYPLRPLGTPETVEGPDLKTLDQVESVRLFVARGQAMEAGFALTAENATALAQICRRLDGIPLALELAAARIPVLRPSEIARRLDDRFGLLSTGSRTSLPRHQTLQALIDWSHDLLTEKERVLFRRLAVFAGRWPLEGAEEVCAGDGLERREVLDLHSRLVEKSLVERDTEAERRCRQVRYRMLETLREYAREKLQASGDEIAVRERCREWVDSLATASSAHLVGPDQAEWSQRLEIDHDNIRAAVADACCGSQPDVTTALRIAGSLGRYWYGRGRWTEGRALLKELLGLPGAEARTACRAQALAWAGWIALWQGDLEEARLYNEESLDIRRTLGDAMGIAQSLNNLGAVALERGEYEQSRAFYEESLAIRRAEGNLRYQAVSLHNLGELCFRKGNYDEARSFHEESLALRRRVGDLMGIADSLNALGLLAERIGDLKLARSRYEESLANREAREDPMGIAESLHSLAEIDAREGRLEGAMRAFRRSLAIRARLGDRLDIVDALESIGLFLAGAGQRRAAARILAGAQSARAGIESAPTPVRAEKLAAAVAGIQRVLGEKRFQSDWAKGERMTLEAVIALASAVKVVPAAPREPGR